MIKRLLRVADIEKTKADELDTSVKKGGQGLKQTMPLCWEPETGSVFARLEKVGVTLESREPNY